jgi:hypothetical protein
MTQLELTVERHPIVADMNPNGVLGLLDAIQRMAPLIDERRTEFDKLRRLPDEVFEAMADAGLFRLWLPRALGGPELSPFEFMRVVEAASALDGSLGWLVGNGGGMSRAGGYVPKAVASEWFASPRAFVAAATGSVGTAKSVRGGYRVAGRWPFGSGAHHASLFMVLAAEEPDGPRLCCYVGRNDVTILDNWHVSGLRGTGSCDFELRDVFVPLSDAARIRIRLDHLGRATGNCPRRHSGVRRACQPKERLRHGRFVAGSRVGAGHRRAYGSNAPCGESLSRRCHDGIDGSDRCERRAIVEGTRGIPDGGNLCR